MSVMRAIVAVLLLALVACGSQEDRFVRPGVPRTSPSGNYVAHTESVSGKTVLLITNPAGDELYRDSLEYWTSERNDGVGVLWLSDRDQLWLLVPGSTHQRVEPDAQGAWHRVADSELPEEIKRLG